MPRRTTASARPAPDTICAVATPAGLGSIAVVRVSGPDTFPVLDRAFARLRPSRQPARTVRLGRIVDERGTEIDEVLVTVFRAPRSYTGDDLAEVSCHGGACAAPAVVDLLCRLGCRRAEPGEFTRRAVLAGKLTLTRAEAILDIVNARTPAAHRAALNRYHGALALEVEELAEQLRALRAEAEYHLGFDEDDAPRPGLRTRQRRLLRRLDRVIGAGERNRFLHEGARIAIVGRPNVGKSTLFNRLLGTERALVTDTPGTTRDRIEATLALGDIPVTLSDTCGIPDRTSGAISRLASRQTETAIRQADIVLAVFDGSRRTGPGDRRVLAATANRTTIHVVNKVDRPARFGTDTLNGRPRVALSARDGTGVGRLRRMLATRLRPGRESAVSGLRPIAALRDCRAALARAIDAPDAELAALEIADALHALESIDAPTDNTDVLDRVFARFCVGK